MGWCASQSLVMVSIGVAFTATTSLVGEVLLLLVMRVAGAEEGAGDAAKWVRWKTLRALSTCWGECLNIPSLVMESDVASSADGAAAAVAALID